MAVIVGRALPDVRDGLKPVHRRVLYAMYDGGYRPDRGFSKCSRVVGDVMGQYHPHGDTAIYDTLVRLAQPWVMRAPLINGQGNFGSPGNDSAAAMRYTECRMAPLAHGDGPRHRRGHRRLPAQLRRSLAGADVLPARFPNLLVNGSAGIAVGMATNIPPHNLREVADGAPVGARAPRRHPRGAAGRADRADQGPRLPQRRADRRPRRASSRPTAPAAARSPSARSSRSTRTPRAAPAWSITELPYMVNPDNLALKIAELADSGKVQGIADVRDDSSGAHRPAPGRRAQARRRRPGRAQQPAQAHRAADQLQRQHAGPGRRRAAHADDRPVHQQLGRPTRSRSSSGGPATACAEAERAGPHLARPGQGARRARRGHRADPALARRRRGPRRA